MGGGGGGGGGGGVGWLIGQVTREEFAPSLQTLPNLIQNNNPKTKNNKRKTHQKEEEKMKEILMLAALMKALTYNSGILSANVNEVF